jgi:hypothetical protein
MANPTGTTYLQANLSYTWADGDVYEIVQTDEVEGASTGASFGGLGVDNQPHQLLLDKIQYLHTKQLADEANIAALLAFGSGIISDVGPLAVPAGVGGWLQLSANDSVLGKIELIMQWGTVALLPYGVPNAPQIPVPLTFDFPIAFPNAVWFLVPYWQLNLANLQQDYDTSPYALAPLQKQGNGLITIINNTNQQSVIAYGSRLGATGIGWVALGY